MRNRRVGIALSYISTFLNMGVGLFLSSFLLRMLGDTEYGLYQTMASFANYLVLLEFGTGTVMTRNLSVCRSKSTDRTEIDKNVSTVWTVTNALAGIIILVSFIFYFSIDYIYVNSLSVEEIIYGKKIFILVTLYMIFGFLNQTLGGIVLAFEKYTYNSTLAIIRQVVRVVLLVGLIFRWRYAIIIAGVDLFINFFLCLFTYIYCKRNFAIKFSLKYFDKTIFKSSLPLSLAIFVQGLVNQANSNVDKFIIGVKIDPETVALYSVAMYIYQILSSLGTIPISIYTPQIAKSVTSGMKGKKMLDSIIEPCRLVTFIAGTTLFGFVVVGRQFICLLYGSEYLQAWGIALIIGFPAIILATNGVMINVLNVMNRNKPRTISLIITTVVNVILTILWIDKWGVVGAATATAISMMLFQVTLLNIYYSKSLKMNMLYLFGKAYKGILQYQVLGVIVALIITKFITNTLCSFLVGGMVYVVIFTIGFYLFGANPSEKALIHSLIEKFR